MAAMSNEVAMEGLGNSAVGSGPPTAALNSLTSVPDMNSEDDEILNYPTEETNAELLTMMKGIYHQDRTPLSQRTNTSDLWMLPNPDQEAAVVYNTHAVAKHFHKTCDLIRTHWNIEPSEVVPEEMRAQTPYSQALLLAIRRLASYTKQRSEVGQKAMVSVWRDRVGKPSGLAFDPTGIQVFETRVDRHLHGAGACEEIIQETNYGLTLEDVMTSRQVAKKFAKGLGWAPPQPGGKLRGGVRGAQRAETREMRQQNKEQKAAAREAELKERQRDLDFLAGKGPASDYKISKKKERKQKSKVRDKMDGEKGYKLLAFLQADDDDAVVLNGNNTAGDVLSGGNAAPPNSPEPNSAQPLDSGEQTMVGTTDHKKTRRNRNHTANPKPTVANYATNQDRHNDRLLSQMFNRVDFDSQHKLKRKKERKLLDDASQRQGSLPIDRVKLAELPALHTQQGARRDEEVLEKLGKVEVKMEEEGVRGNSVFADAPGGNQGLIGKSVFANQSGGNRSLIGKSVFANGLGGTQREFVVLSDDEEL